ncbi:MAG: PAS domain-containing protein, partial [Oceanobacter sp.]
MSALTISSSAFYAFEFYFALQDSQKKLNQLGTLSASYLGQSDSEVSNSYQVIDVLKADKDVLHLCIYSESGELTQGYSAEPDHPCPESYTRLSDHTTDQVHQTFQINNQQENLGWLHLELRLADYHQRLGILGNYLLVIGLVSVALIVLLASRLKKIITAPVVNLSETLTRIVEDKDYSIRAIRDTDDDLGKMVVLFNQLLETIESEQDQLRSNEERFRKLADFSPVGIFEVDDQQNLIFVNQKWCDIHQIHAPEPTLEHLISCIAPADIADIRKSWLNMVRKHENLSREVQLLLPDGSRTWVHMMASPL